MGALPSVSAYPASVAQNVNVGNALMNYLAVLLPKQTSGPSNDIGIQLPCAALSYRLLMLISDRP